MAGRKRRPARRRRKGKRRMAELDGPRLEPRSGAARQLVVFLHGYGADGNDLIEIGRAWQQLLPHAAFVSPHAPRPCGQAPTGREWFPLTFRNPEERWTGVNEARPILDSFRRCRAQAAKSSANGPGSGRIQPRHNDVASRWLAVRCRAGRRSSAIPECLSAGKPRARNRSRPKYAAGRRSS